jgi:hypothetical protein
VHAGRRGGVLLPEDVFACGMLLVVLPSLAYLLMGPWGLLGYVGLLILSVREVLR